MTSPDLPRMATISGMAPVRKLPRQCDSSEVEFPAAMTLAPLSDTLQPEMSLPIQVHPTPDQDLAAYSSGVSWPKELCGLTAL